MPRCDEIHHLFNCEICGGLHRWEFFGDCRTDAERYADEEDYAKRNGVALECVNVHTMTERVDSDVGAPPPWSAL